jgi:SagB-type dehydrogenase family enzyme
MVAVFLIGIPVFHGNSRCETTAKNSNGGYALPAPDESGAAFFEKILSDRRSIRQFKNQFLSKEQVAQILWAAQGITSPEGFRTAPSAGALFPLEVYLVAGGVEGIRAGIYRYLPASHEIKLVKSGDFRKDLYAAALNQSAIITAPASILITGVMARTAAKYGRRGIQYVWMEAGHAGQNILLQAVSLGLGAVPIGAFDDNTLRQLLGIGQDELPVYIIPIGYPSSE